MTIDCTRILSFDLIIYGRKQSDSTLSLVYGVKITGHSCEYCAYLSDHPLKVHKGRPTRKGFPHFSKI